MYEYEKDGAAIYRQSFATIRAEADLTGLPADVVAVVQTYILPSVLGAVLVQAVVSTRNLRMTVIAGVVAAAVVFLLVPTVPTLAFFGTAIAVIATAVLAWFLRDRSAEADPVAPQPEASSDDLRIG